MNWLNDQIEINTTKLRKSPMGWIYIVYDLTVHWNYNITLKYVLLDTSSPKT